MFNLTISCLTTSNLPWFMDLIFEVPMQYCSLQNQILLSSPDTSTEHLFCFCPATSFFLELLVIALNSSPGAYWTPYDPRGLTFQSYIFLPFHAVHDHGVLAARILEGVAILSSNRPHFIRTLDYFPSILGVPARHGSYFHWVIQAPSPWHDCDPWRGSLTTSFLFNHFATWFIEWLAYAVREILYRVNGTPEHLS